MPCGCASCKEQLGQPWVLPYVDIADQSRYSQNKECTLWPSHEGANDWKIVQLVPKTEVMVCEGEMGAIGTTDEAALGYYVIKWLSDPYTLQEEMAEGMSGVIGAGTMVADVLYFNRVERATHWYTQSNMTTVVEVKHVLLTGFQLQPISNTNKLQPRVIGGRLHRRRL